jgi:hypothetical protein
MDPLGVCGDSRTSELHRCLFYGGEDGRVRGMGEIGRGQPVPRIWEQIRILDQQLGCLPLRGEQSITRAGQ